MKYSQIHISKYSIPQFINWVLPLLILFGLLLTSPPKLIRPGLVKKYTEKENDFLNDVKILKKYDGLFISENILLNYSSDKEFVYDSFFVSQLLKSGKLNEKDLIKSIEDGKYSIIQLNKRINPNCDKDRVYGSLKFPEKQHGRFSGRFSINTLKAIENHYSLFHNSRNGFYYRYNSD